VDHVFEWLTDEPLASASLGQVYRGKLRPEWGGEEVAVKVQRPGVLESVSLDIFIMRRAALIFSKLPGVRSSCLFHEGVQGLGERRWGGKGWGLS
jgi:aarF domain-containing kinase